MQTTTYPRRALRLPAVLDKTGLSRTQWLRLVQRGDAPPPVKLSERVSAWDEAVIDRWLAAKFDAAA